MRIAPKTSVFERTSARCRANGAINLGQGFPDGCGPLTVREAAARAIIDGPHHYPPMPGLPALRQAIAAHYGRHHGLALDPDAEVTVTSGATEAIAAALLGLVSPGERVVIIEPAYDAYAPLAERAGAEVVRVALQPPEWRLTAEMLEAACAGGVRMIVVNDPMNPTGRRFTAEERGAIRDAAVRHDTLVLADDVWEWVVPPDAVHAPLIADPVLRERTVKIGSAGKIFAFTGWKVGWMCAAPELTRHIRATHQYLAFTTPPALQTAVAAGLEEDAPWLAAMRAEVADGRARFEAGLRNAGYAVLPSDSTWFLCVDLAASGVEMDAEAFCDRMIDGFGVAGIPVSAFAEKAPPRSVVRFCHAKSAATLDAAVERLAAAREALGR